MRSESVVMNHDERCRGCVLFVAAAWGKTRKVKNTTVVEEI
jgi:hypothetical protein